MRREEGLRKGGDSRKLAEGRVLATESAKSNRRLMSKNSFGNIVPITPLDPLSN